MICIYHSRDLDGWMSAAIVKLKFPNVTLVGWDYGQPVPDIAFKEVILVDVTLPTMFMVDNVNRITWIDHHFSAIKTMSELEPLPFFYGLRNDKFAACELTWQFFFPNERIPEIVRLLGRYDCFGHKGTDEEQKVLEFQYGARAVISNPDDAYSLLIECTRTKESEYWFLQAQVVVGRIHELGRGIYKYLCTEAQQIYAKRFTVMYDRYKFAMVNQDRFNPINFGIDYHKDGYDGFACFWYSNGKWTFSLYNDNGKVDCSEICKQNGGGGHKGAAGFVKDDINWLFQYIAKV
jgi:oligoribonuclease NrnB/cAMP/cGMP phosphodiesterase (DHH superfamily)